MFITQFFRNPEYCSIWLLVVIFSICTHEYMHARVALWQGDSTAADEGHLTLNPFKQMGVFSLVMLIFIGIAWGSVPVNPSKMKHKYSDVLVSAAGPLTNLVLFVVFSLLLGVTIGLSSKYAAYTAFDAASPWQTANMLFNIGGILNFILFVFNLLPIPGLDGWHVVSRLFPSLQVKNQQLFMFISFILLLLIIYFFDYLFLIGQLATTLIAHLSLTLFQ
ncbi:site-2 protease family protein [Lentisphaerota bacterium ZTH]|nr:site-2 protease family protein [Lentisphaerota bacterium]WET05423.1 site-2 protease family protein [Lentisphaerota bacterium ZTH]